MDDTMKLMVVVFAIIIVAIVAFAAFGAGSGTQAATGALSGSGPSYLPGTLGGGCGV